MALPSYASTGQRVWHYTFRTICGLIFFYLIAPILVIIPLSFNATVDLILSEHMTAARACVRNPEILKELESEIERDCDQLRSFLFAAQVRAVAQARK